MIDVQDMLYRQACWQRSLATLSWQEKLRMARDSSPGRPIDGGGQGAAA